MREFWSSPLFLAFKTFIPPWSFAIQHSDFSSFLAVSTTDKPVNRNINAHPPKIAERFYVKGIYLSWYSQKTRKEFEQFGL